jgi:hypothetical protein
MSINTTETDGRDAKSGRFLPGNSGFGGRPRGARSKLGEAFIADLHDVWERHGIAALEATAKKKPAEFCRIIASLLPQNVNLSVALDASDFATKYQAALAALGNEPPRLARSVKVIDHA